MEHYCALYLVPMVKAYFANPREGKAYFANPREVKAYFANPREVKAYFANPFRASVGTPVKPHTPVSKPNSSKISLNPATISSRVKPISS